MALFDSSSDPAKEVYYHGMALEPENKRVQCHYCGKVVPGFNRLQHHLGGIRGNIIECPDVPTDVKEFFRNSLLVAKVGRLVKEVGDVFQPGPPVKRSCTTSDVKENGNKLGMVPGSHNVEFSLANIELIEPAGRGFFGEMMPSCSGKLASPRGSACFSGQGESSSVLLNACTSNGKANAVNLGKVTGSQNGQVKRGRPPKVSAMANRYPREATPNCSGKSTSESPSACFGKAGQDSASTMAKRCIGRFFFENGIDFSAIKSHSFKNMMEMISVKSVEVSGSFPSIQELKGWVLDDELHDMQTHVKRIQLSWPRTGCSIQLDGWTDQLGRNLINVIVTCPEGPIYLRSADVSASMGSDALQLLLESVLAEVGVQNVVQIFFHASSGNVEALSTQLMEKYRTLFCTVSATHCICLMLEKIAMVHSINLTLEKAKTITKFIYSQDAVLNLSRKFFSNDVLVISSKIKIAASFLTLENFWIEKRNLEVMFTSSDWLNSFWASTAEGKAVANLIADKYFWDGVVVAVKASIPLVKAISLINGDGEPNMGFIYETLDQVKETISDEFRGREAQYTQFWNIIDEIWNPILHSPLHAAGYFLNPRLHYTEDFFSDTEVAGGLLITVVKLEDDQHVQDLITQQLDVYGNCKGDFSLGTENNYQHKISPATWWSRFGSHCPELQRVAVRILSQTCSGAECYDLRRDLAESLLSPGRNSVEQERLQNLTYVHYNMRLKRFKMGAVYNIKDDDIDPMNEWIVDEIYRPEVPVSKSGEPSGSRSIAAAKSESRDFRGHNSSYS